jgi:hypothetical protein
MAAPTNTADVKKTLANSQPSTHGPSRHSRRRNNTVAFGAKQTFSKPRLQSQIYEHALGQCSLS